MPRDGSGNYTYPPGTPGIPDTTIESAKYNGYIADIQQDLNLPRPIVAGGTGANNATAARANIGCEVSSINQVVTNYDTQVWESGSFASSGGAIGAPTASEHFMGVAVLLNATQLYINLRAVGNTTGKTYTRLKQSGMWAAWTAETDVLNGKVNKAGDTMTGSLTISASSDISIVSSRTLGGASSQFRLESEGPVVKGYFFWERASDSLFIQNAGAITVKMDSTGHVSLANGFMGKAGFAGAYASYIHNFFWTGSLQAWVDTTNVGTVTLTSDYRIKKDVIDLPGMWDTVKAMRPIKYTQAQFTPPSDVKYKLERALTARQAGLDTPEGKEGSEFVPMFAADEIERWGFVAHELQATLLPTAASGVKDQPDAIQSLNLAPVVAALTKALQEAMARIEALEAAQAAP